MRSPRLPKKQFVGRLEGAKVAGGERRGLLLTQKLDTGDLLVIDLRTGGRLRRAAAKDAVEKGTQVVVTFTQGGQLRMVDGSGGLDVWVATPEELLEQVPELSTSASTRSTSRSRGRPSGGCCSSGRRS